MIDPAALAVVDVHWPTAVRLIRSVYPPIDLFEDIADPADWPLLISAEMKTNPRLVENIGNVELVPERRRVGGSGASYVMAPFTHVSPDRQGRFHDGTFGALYAGDRFEVALFETAHHHGRFMARTGQPPGWTSQFREILLTVDARLHDLRVRDSDLDAILDPNDHSKAQALAGQLRADQSNGVVYRSVRYPSGECVALFYPDLAVKPLQGRHLDYHWDGERVDLYRDAGTGAVVRIL